MASKGWSDSGNAKNWPQRVDLTLVILNKKEIWDVDKEIRPKPIIIS